MSKTIEVVFSVSGYVEQAIEILDDRYDQNRIIEGLNNGEIFTTIQEGGEVIFINEKGGSKVIGKVVNVDNNCEYSEFSPPFCAKSVCE